MRWKFSPLNESNRTLYRAEPLKNSAHSHTSRLFLTLCCSVMEAAAWPITDNHISAIVRRRCSCYSAWFGRCSSDARRRIRCVARTKKNGQTKSACLFSTAGEIRQQRSSVRLGLTARSVVRPPLLPPLVLLLLILISEDDIGFAISSADKGI